LSRLVESLPSYIGAMSKPVFHARPTSSGECSADALIASARYGIVGLDATGRVQCVNPAAEELLGRPVAELAGKTLAELLGQELAERLRREQQVDGWPLETGDLARMINLSLSPLDDRQPDGAAGLFLRDVSQSLRLRRSLEHSERLSQLGKMAAGIAHEVGNPLAGISSIVQSLLKGLPEDDPTRERLNLVKQQVTRITGILRQLVEYSRPARRDRRPLDLNDLIRDAARLLSYDSRARGVDLTLELDDQLPALMLESHPIQQLLLNLLHNSLDATEGRSYRAVRVTSRLAGNRAVIHVDDTGPGVPEELRAQVFDPFFTTKDPGAGTGLGLWICRGIADALGGRLSVEQAPGSGARFVLELNLESGHAEHTGR
jgi:C4-dicarboxylate-specific signal transduction histidine kinase